MGTTRAESQEIMLRASSCTGGPRANRLSRANKHRKLKRSITAYLFLLPFLVLFTTFVIAPAFFGLWISFTDYSPFKESQTFVGLNNFLTLFSPENALAQDFWRSMRATALFMVLSVPVLIIIPLFIAVLLNQKMRAATVFRGVFFAPYVLGVAVVGVIWRYILDTQSGVLNHLLSMLGLPGDIPWTVDTPWVWISLVGVTVWWTSGLNTVIFLAGMKGINPDLYEAALLDGAGPVRSFISITLPGLRQVMLFVTTTTLLASANMFGQSFLITAGGPGAETRTAIMYISDQGLSQNNMGCASAMSYILFAFLAILSVINFRLQQDKSKGRLK